MKREKFWIVVVFFALGVGLMSCSKSDETTIGPEIKFADGVNETTAKSAEVSVTITSSIGLKKVVVDKIVDNKVVKVIENITEFENPKQYHFVSEFSVTERTLIRFTAVDTENQQSIDSFAFELK